MAYVPGYDAHKLADHKRRRERTQAEYALGLKLFKLSRDAQVKVEEDYQSTETKVQGKLDENKTVKWGDVRGTYVLHSTAYLNIFANNVKRFSDNPTVFKNWKAGTLKIRDDPMPTDHFDKLPEQEVEVTITRCLEPRIFNFQKQKHAVTLECFLLWKMEDWAEDDLTGFGLNPRSALHYLAMVCLKYPCQSTTSLMDTESTTFRRYLDVWTSSA